jgi:hypothetical protein
MITGYDDAILDSGEHFDDALALEKLWEKCRSWYLNKHSKTESPESRYLNELGT